MTISKLIAPPAVALLAGIVMLFGGVGLASAATFSNVEFQNGQTTVEGTGGSNVTATFRVVVGVNEVVEQIQTDVIGDGLAPVCTSVGGTLGLEQGTHNVSIQVKLPPNTGTHNLDVQGSGIYGAFRADDCVGDVVGSASFAGALRVVATGSGNTGSSTSDLQSLIADLVKQVSCLSTGGTWATGVCTPKPTAPAPSTKCAAVNAKLIGTVDNSYNSANVMLQGYLLSEGMSIPALAAGASFGYKGPQTNAALAQFKAMNQCI